MALYHKHRPQTFASVIGQDVVTETIKSQIIHDSIAHAYLFSGPRGVGKTTTARLIAKAVNCKRLAEDSAEVDPTDPDAIEITEGRSMDVMEIDAASHTGVDHVREHIIENARFKPTKLKYKVFIIDEVHMLSTSAFNALLKILEEPPAHVIFILATTELHKLPDTIISRCQRFRFRRVASAVLVEHLNNVAETEGVSIDEGVLKRIVGKSDGCVRDAMSLLEQIMTLGEKKITEENAALFLPANQFQACLQCIEAIVQKNHAQAIQLILSQVDHGVSMRIFADDLLAVFRDILVLSLDTSTEQPYQYDAATWQAMQNLSKEISAAELVRCIDALIVRRNMIARSSIASLPLELFIVEACGEEAPVKTQHAASQQAITSASQPAAVKTPPAASQQSTTTVSQSGPVKIQPAASQQEITASEASPASTSTNLSKASITQQWQQLIATVEATSPSLISILRMTEIQDLRGNTLILQVPFAFHRDKLLEKQCSRLLLDNLEKLVGARLQLDVILTKKEGNTKQEQSVTKETVPDDVTAIADVFGGTVLGASSA